MDWTYNEETKIITGPERPVNICRQGLGYCLFESLKNHQGKIAQINIETGEFDSYDSLLQRSTRCAIAMRRYGLKPGDVVTTFTYNQINAVVPFVSATFLGVINTTLDPGLSEDDIKYLVDIVKPKLFFVSEDCESIIEKIAKDLQAKVVVFGTSQTNVNFATFCEVPIDEECTFTPYAAADLNETIFVLFSSGTSGMPKGICISHNFAMNETVYQPDDVSYNFATLYWVSSTFMLLGTLRKGKVKALSKTLNNEKMWEYIEKYKINAMTLAPFQAVKLISCKPRGHVSSLEKLWFGGTTTSNEDVIKLRSALPKTRLAFVYGLTEVGMVSNPFTEVSYKKLTSVGVPHFNTSYKIVDPETEDNVGFNQTGEIRVKPKHCLKGYYNRDSSDVWDKDGFVKTGDVGYFDEEFCFFVVDRIKEMFKYRGLHIVPTKLENVLMQHPDIETAVIVGVPHQQDEHHILAVVVLKENSEETASTIEQFYNDQIDDRNKIRAGVQIVNSIPRTATDKINRKVLKQLMVDKLCKHNK